ncbi:MAG: Ig-like domain-containing protein [Bacilli bacterium]|nr:Ig-like domain-containing protein [Bacilli bacterium]
MDLKRKMTTICAGSLLALCLTAGAVTAFSVPQNEAMVVNAAGSTYEINVSTLATEKGWSNAVAYTNVVCGDFTFTVNGGANDGKYYTSDSTWRFYSGGKLTVTAKSGLKITGVTTAASSSFSKTSDTVWSASFTATTKLSRITISYEEGGGDDPTPSADKKTLDFTKTTQCTSASTNSLVYASSPVTFTIDKDGSTTPANNYYPGTTGQSYSSTRVYKNSKITIDAGTGNVVTLVKITAATTAYATTLANATWTGATAAASGSTVTVTPTLTAKSLSFVPGGTAGFTTVEVSYSSSTAPSISIKNTPSSVEVDDTFYLSYEKENATHPVVAWSSSNTSVISVDSTGTCTANSYGTAEITAMMTCDEGTAADKVTITVNAGLMFINEVVTIGNSLNDGSTTAYTVTTFGYVTSLNADGKDPGYERALNVSEGPIGSEGPTVMVYGIYSDNEFRDYAILNGLVTVTGKVQKYVKSGTTTIEIVSPVIGEYTDDAEDYASDAYATLNVSCTTGPAAVTLTEWNTLKSGFEALDQYAQEKLSQATASYAYSEDIAKWLGRYTKIVSQRPDLDNFMNVTINSAFLNPTMSFNDNVVVTIAIVSLFGLGAVAGLVVMGKKKHN